MNKGVKFISGFLYAGIFIFQPFNVSANTLTGKIIDVFSDKVTIEMEREGLFQKGDQIELNYMAGVMEMMIGSYEVVQAQKIVFIAKEISIVMAPSKGMNVNVIKAQGFVYNEPDPGAMEPPSRDPRFNNVSPEDYEIKFDDQKAPDVKIQGEVIEVKGTDVRIQLTSSGEAQVCFAADLTYVTSSGIELPVGTWKVISVNDREVTATTSDESVKPRKGMKALVYASKGKVSALECLPPEPTANQNRFVEEESFFNDMASSSTTAPFVPGAYPLKNEETLTLQQEIERGVELAGEEIANNELENQQRNSERMAALRLYAAGTSRRYLLGAEIADNEDASKQKYAEFLMGVVVVDVLATSAAQRGGIKKRDIIFRVNGTGVNNKEHFISLINRSDGKVKLEIQRNNKNIKKTIKLDKAK